MEINHDDQMLRKYVAAAVDVSPERPILIDKFLDNAIEVEADGVVETLTAMKLLPPCTSNRSLPSRPDIVKIATPGVRRTPGPK